MSIGYNPLRKFSDEEISRFLHSALNNLSTEKLQHDIQSSPYHFYLVDQFLKLCESAPSSFWAAIPALNECYSILNVAYNSISVQERSNLTEEAAILLSNLEISTDRPINLIEIVNLLLHFQEESGLPPYDQNSSEQDDKPPPKFDIKTVIALISLILQIHSVAHAHISESKATTLQSAKDEQLYSYVEEIISIEQEKSEQRSRIADALQSLDDNFQFFVDFLNEQNKCHDHVDESTVEHTKADNTDKLSDS